ncbi:MAG: hypothetical protein MSS56_05280 [Spirochaetia bacterium]|nr:hypothetical protein [Spirochaetia bacterium]
MGRVFLLSGCSGKNLKKFFPSNKEVINTCGVRVRETCDFATQLRKEIFSLPRFCGKNHKEFFSLNIKVKNICGIKVPDKLRLATHQKIWGQVPSLKSGKGAPEQAWQGSLWEHMFLEVLNA